MPAHCDHTGASLRTLLVSGHAVIYVNDKGATDGCILYFWKGIYPLLFFEHEQAPALQSQNQAD